VGKPEEKRENVKDLGVYESIISQFIFRKQDMGLGVDCATSGQEQEL